MKLPSKFGYVLLSVGVGAAIGGALGYLAKRHYQKWALEEINKADKVWERRLDDKNNTIYLASKEIYEMREVCQLILDPAQYETIRDMVHNHMESDDKLFPESHKEIMKQILNVHKVRHDAIQEAAQMSVDLGYQSDSDEETDAEERLYGEKKREAMRRKAEANMDDGFGEFDDMPPIGPDGDIIDEIDDEDSYSDDEPWTDDSSIYVSGEDVVKDEPYLITEWQFSYGKRDYTKVSLEYLALDDTVLDEDESELDQSFIGPENLRAFETDDCDSIFIRNDQLQIDYEIMWTEHSYIHDILGYPESEVAGRRIWRSWEKER